MSRPKFDPSKMTARRAAGGGPAPLFAGPAPAETPPQQAQPAPPTRAADAQPLTVSALAARIDSSLKTGLPVRIRVTGEVSGFRERTHWYFDLKDADAVVNCVMFRTAASRAGFTPENGGQVVLSGRVEFYAKAGRVSFIADSIEPVGAGALELAFRKLVAEIRALGWFDQARKRPLPTFPRRVAVITSRSGAALQDVLVTMRRRCPAVGVLVVDARVQGEGAAEEVARAINAVSAAHERLRVDAVLVTRGGGSAEDLWAFNEKVVAEAIVRCAVPVVAAIGHETDTTIAELVADERCATPTQAAVRLTPDSSALQRQLDSTGRRLAGLLRRDVQSSRSAVDSRADGLASAAAIRLQRSASRLERLAARLERQRPAAVHARTIARLHAGAARLGAALRSRLAGFDTDALADRLARAEASLVTSSLARLSALEKHLRSVGPGAVLDRGFSVTTTGDGAIVRSVSQVGPGDTVRTRTADGDFTSVVDTGAPNRPRPTARSDRPKKLDPARDESPGLFS